MSKSLSPNAAADAPRKLFIALAATAGVVFVLVAGGLYLLNTKIVAGQKVVDEKQAQVSNSQSIAGKYQSTLDNYNDTVQKLRFVEPKMTTEAYVATLVQQLQTCAGHEGIQLTAVRPSDVNDPGATAKPAPGDKTAKADTPPPYKQMLCSVTVSGTYPSIMKFVYDLPRFPKIISVQGIALHPVSIGDTNKSTGSLTADIGLNAYIFDDTTNPAKPLQVTGTGAGAQMVSFDSNPVAAAAGHVVGAARADLHAASASERTGGIIDETKGPHSMQGGLGSEQQVPVR